MNTCEAMVAKCVKPHLSLDSSFAAGERVSPVPCLVLVCFPLFEVCRLPFVRSYMVLHTHLCWHEKHRGAWDCWVHRSRLKGRKYISYFSPAWSHIPLFISSCFKTFTHSFGTSVYQSLVFVDSQHGPSIQFPCPRGSFIPSCPKHCA